nr:ribosomal RNA small subunit methyltransferase A [candidate division Zixibacteria bacterium]
MADKKIADRIVALLDTTPDDVIFEIGSGRGTLTKLIAESGARVFSFELDRRLIDDLNKKFDNCENVRIVNGDFLRVEPGDYYSGKFKLIGNIPYDITSPLIDWIIRFRERIVRAVITTQKELGDRISSHPGSRDWAPIAVFCQCFFEIKTVMTIPPSAFYPPPRVISSALIFEPRTSPEISDRETFELIVRRAFKQRRKLLVNNLDGFEGLDRKSVELILDSLGIDPKSRAEQLGIGDFIALSEAITSAKLS